MATIPTDERYRQLWGELSFSDRRRILRAVNSGKALEDPSEAAIAVAAADRQEGFWAKIWMLAPLAALVFLGQGWVAVAANAALATAALGGLSWWRLRRVRRAEARNRAVAAGADPQDANADRPPPPAGRRSHTPRRREHLKLPPDAKGVRPGAGEPKSSRRRRRKG